MTRKLRGRNFPGCIESRCILAQVIITNVGLSGAEQYTNHALGERRRNVDEKGDRREITEREIDLR